MGNTPDGGVKSMEEAFVLSRLFIKLARKISQLMLCPTALMLLLLERQLVMGKSRFLKWSVKVSRFQSC